MELLVKWYIPEKLLFSFMYKILLTLSFTQVACERVFSNLKIVKSRLRSLLGQELLESFLLMNVEWKFLSEITNHEIQQFTGTSKALQKII